MSLLSIFLAFLGGIFGATIGAIPAIGLCGFFVLIGSTILAINGDDTFLNQVAFGYFFGPHIAFSGAVAATAYLGSKNIANFKGTDIDCSPYISQNSIMLFVGGIFGLIGYLSAYFITELLHIPVDGGAIGIVVTSVITRLIFGQGKLLSGKDDNNNLPTVNINEFIFGFIWTIAFSAIVAWMTQITSIPFFGFGIGAFIFLFSAVGAHLPPAHHIGISSALAMMTFNSFFIAILFGIAAFLLFELIAKYLNTNVKTHIDPPAYAIAVITLLLNWLT